MNNVQKEKLKIYETILSSPGMNDLCKVTLKVNRQIILVISQLIEAGMENEKENDDAILKLLSKESREELAMVVPELLQRGGLTVLYEKLKNL